MTFGHSGTAAFELCAAGRLVPAVLVCAGKVRRVESFCCAQVGRRVGHAAPNPHNKSIMKEIFISCFNSCNISSLLCYRRFDGFADWYRYLIARVQLVPHCPRMDGKSREGRGLCRA